MSSLNDKKETGGIGRGNVHLYLGKKSRTSACTLKLKLAYLPINQEVNANVFSLSSLSTSVMNEALRFHGIGLLSNVEKYIVQGAPLERASGAESQQVQSSN